MKHQVKLCLKIAWLVTTVAIFFMGNAICVANREACVPAGRTMFWLMLLITFPTGVFSSLVAMVFVEPAAIHDPADFNIAWIVMMVGGLIQWFVFVPSLFEAPGLTSLNLKPATRPAVICLQDGPPNSGNEVIEERKVLAAGEIAAPTTLTLPSTAPAANHRPQRSRKSTKRIAAFDKRGRTPLERVLDRL